jgi:hypothetical protein
MYKLLPAQANKARDQELDWGLDLKGSSKSVASFGTMAYVSGRNADTFHSVSSHLSPGA